MRPFIYLAASALLLSASECNKKTAGTKFKGRLEVAGICMNYTISIIEGDPGPGAVAADWTDEMTKKEYRNVFKLGNPCDFPAHIKAGSEFYFVIDTAKGKDCAVCMAYYPTPPKALSIKVVE